MLKIDIHTHIIPKNLPDFDLKYGYSGFISLNHHKPCCAQMIQNGKMFREIGHNCWDAGVRIEECAAHGVSVQVLSTIPIMFCYWAKPYDAYDISRYLNDEIAQICTDYPKRFIGLGTLPMQAPELAIREMTRCVKELGLAGVEIGTHINSWNFYDEHLFPFFQAAEELGAALFVHPWDMMAKDKMPKYWLPWLVGMPAETSLAICSMIFGGIFERLPKLRVAFAHGGGAFPATIGRIEHAHKMRPDLCAVDNPTNPRDYIGRFYVDSIVHDRRYFQYMLDLFSPKCIALGSDYPFPLGELEPGKLIETHPGLSNVDKERMLSGTALEWLNLEVKNFSD